MATLTRPRGVKPVFDVEDLLIFRATVRLLTDLVIFGNLLLKAKIRGYKIITF